MALPRLSIDGHWFREPGGRRVLLRGVNLGGDCKVPFPSGGTYLPTDFSNHRDVSFVGRPFPLSEADEHLGRLRHWGFNCLRLLTTWEAVEHKGPEQYDTAYLDYLAELIARADALGLYVFIDFHQDVWSRMTGGDGAPAWLFEKVGLDFRKFHAAGAAHVMQYKYDFSRGGRQEDRYPMMTWSENYRLPANAIMWTLFFAGRTFAPKLEIDGKNVQDYLQDHYLGAMRAVAERVKDLTNVVGFDSLNEPGSGMVGLPMSYRHVERSAEHPEPVRPGAAWSPLDALLVARGVSAVIPRLAFDPAKMKVVIKSQEIVNPDKVSIWLKGHKCPFEQAGAYKLTKDGRTEAVREDFFTLANGQSVDHERDFMLPFFHRVAQTMRAVEPSWLLFAELDPFKAFSGGGGFPKGMPERTVNASHWYDIVTLSTKTFMYPISINPFTGKTLEGRAAIQALYTEQLARLKSHSAGLGGAPALVGEFGIPFDLDGAYAFEEFLKGDTSEAPWSRHILAQELMYNAMDTLLLHSTQWNYTASNRNDLAIGDGWNQEDLSIFSRDQQTDPSHPDSGGRGVRGFVRPYVRACQGTPKSMLFDMERGMFSLVYDADPEIAEPTDIYVPLIHFPNGFMVQAEKASAIVDRAGQRVRVRTLAPGERTVTIVRRA